MTSGFILEDLLAEDTHVTKPQILIEHPELIPESVEGGFIAVLLTMLHNNQLEFQDETLTIPWLPSAYHGFMKMWITQLIGDPLTKVNGLGEPFGTRDNLEVAAVFQTARRGTFHLVPVSLGPMSPQAVFKLQSNPG